MTCDPGDLPPKAKQASRAYMRDMAIAAVVYVGVVFGAVTLIRHMPFSLPQWLVVIVALTPLMPALMMVRTYMTYLRFMDELGRRIQTEAWLISAAVVGLGTFTYSFLEEWAHFPRIDLVWIFPALIFFWGIATFYVRRRYK
ncbi:MAG: hypothetical protein WAU68_11285 [Vitreimonas sp.]